MLDRSSSAWRRCRYVMLVAMCVMPLLASRRLSAADPELRSFAPAEAAIVLESQAAVTLLEQPFLREIWQLLLQTAGGKRASQGPEAERLRQFTRFMQGALGVEWQQGLTKLTSGGVLLAVNAGKSPETALVVVSDTPETLARFVAAAQEQIKKQGDKIRTFTYQDQTCYQVGEGHYAVIGKHFLLSNREAGMQKLVDRLLAFSADANPAKDPATAQRPWFTIPAPLLTTEGKPSSPVLRVAFHLKKLREDEKFAEGVEIPSNKVEAIFLLGGYLDLLRRSDVAVTELHADARGLEVRLKFPVGALAKSPALEGFFATAEGEQAAPLLRPQGVLYSSTWYRDYARMWDRRSELLKPELVQTLEEQNRKLVDTQKQLGFVKLLQMLGPHWRLVVLPPGEPLYRVQPAEKLPTAALLVDIRDVAGFKSEVAEPLERFVKSPVSLAVRLTKSSTYKVAHITTLRFHDDPKVVGKKDKTPFNFDPAFTLTRGHFIIGATTAAVRTVIDELDLPAEKRSAAVTEESSLSLSRLPEYLQTFHERMLRGAILNEGITLPEAEAELKVQGELLRRLEQITTRTELSADRFEMRLRVGATAP